MVESQILSGETQLEFAEKTLTGSFSKLAIVNLLTGEYDFIKKDSEFVDEGYDDIPDIYTYIKRQIYDGTVFPEYADDYLRYSRPAYVQRRVFSGEKRAVHSYKRKVKGGSKWITFNVIAGKDCCPENPWALFCWREADTDTTMMVDALETLTSLYYKILKVNLTADTYNVVKATEHFTQRPDTISGWFKSFAEAGNVYEEDLVDYNSFTNIDRLRRRFSESKSRYCCRYRRLNGTEYRWVEMILIPSIEYTDKNQIINLYVKDIHDEHVSEIRSRAALVETYKRDALTLLFNRHKFNDDIAELDESGFGQLTCMYLDVNGLHEVNNHLGHQSGDDMLCTVADALKKFFPDERCYRIGGDEFVVLCRNLSKPSVEKLLAEVRKFLMKDGYEVAAGIASGGSDIKVEKILGTAELAMREDKELYYRTNGDIRKRRTMNAELEKMLAEKNDEEKFLKIISNHFAGVYFVDMEHDTVRHIYIPSYFAELLEKSDYCYSEAMKLYARKYVKANHAERFERLLNYKWLLEKLRNDGTLSFTYQKADGHFMHINILMNDNKGDGPVETVWIFGEDSKILD